MKKETTKKKKPSPKRFKISTRLKRLEYKNDTMKVTFHNDEASFTFVGERHILAEESKTILDILEGDKLASEIRIQIPHMDTLDEVVELLKVGSLRWLENCKSGEKMAKMFVNADKLGCQKVLDEARKRFVKNPIIFVTDDFCDIMTQQGFEQLVKGIGKFDATISSTFQEEYVQKFWIKQDNYLSGRFEVYTRNPRIQAKEVSKTFQRAAAYPKPKVKFSPFAEAVLKWNRKNPSVWGLTKIQDILLSKLEV